MNLKPIASCFVCTRRWFIFCVWMSYSQGISGNLLTKLKIVFSKCCFSIFKFSPSSSWSLSYHGISYATILTTTVTQLYTTLAIQFFLCFHLNGVNTWFCGYLYDYNQMVSFEWSIVVLFPGSSLTNDTYSSCNWQLELVTGV